MVGHNFSDWHIFLCNNKVKSQPASDAVMPSITIEDTPITSAIENLSQFAGQDYLLDPNFCSSFLDSNGKPTREPKVSFSWTNLTASQALSKLLNEHGLTMVINPVTSVALITYTNHVVIPLDANLLGSDTNEVVPPINFRNMPLNEAFKKLANVAHFEVAIDFKIPPGSNMPNISVRWKNVTARQAIVALCEAYNLVIAKDSATGAIKIQLQRNHNHSAEDFFARRHCQNHSRRRPSPGHEAIRFPSAVGATSL